MLASSFSSSAFASQDPPFDPLQDLDIAVQDQMYVAPTNMPTD